MLKKSFKLKIIVPTIIIFVVLVIVINVFLSLRFSAINSELIGDKLVANANSLILFLESSRESSRAAAVSMARYPNAIEAINSRDREELLRIFTPTHDLYGVNYYTITDGEGVVLARTHDPDNYNDSVINQQNVIDAVNGNVSSYFESGTVVKVSIRTGAPVYDTDGELIGVVSAGVRFDTECTVKDLKELLNSDVSIFLDDVRIATTIHRDGQSIVGTTMDPRIVETVIYNKNEYSGEADILGEMYIAYYKPLVNAQGEAYATFFTGTPVDDLIERSNNSIRDGIILGLAGLAVSIILLYFIISAVIRPVTELSNSMAKIADGNLSININVKNEDEIGVLGKSLQKIAQILYKLLEEIKQMIVEHDKGNIVHSINIDEFSGGYKVLANDIVTLANVSLKDQLTGIPNRRSFDNRLDMEWNRAKRDKNPLSILVIDIDCFKNYNDTFGHQQGDLALQSIAATITGLLKRTTDFAARWGGEEFVVLLPVTDPESALFIAEKIRSGIESAEISGVDEKARKITVSIGAYTLIPTQESCVADFISKADSALYIAKSEGRNKVVMAENR